MRAGLMGCVWGILLVLRRGGFRVCVSRCACIHVRLRASFRNLVQLPVYFYWDCALGPPPLGVRFVDFVTTFPTALSAVPLPRRPALRHLISCTSKAKRAPNNYFVVEEQLGTSTSSKDCYKARCRHCVRERRFGREVYHRGMGTRVRGRTSPCRRTQITLSPQEGIGSWQGALGPPLAICK